jgi:hypothetical protein
MPSDRGQGTVEYLAVVLLVAVVLGGGATAAVASGASAGIATAVPHQVMRALCIVTGGDCERDRAPCDVASSTNSSSWSATVAVFRVGHNRVVVVDRRSDGTTVVTLTTAPSAGLQTVEGASARIERGRRRLTLGGGVTASAVASIGHGKAWVLPPGAAVGAFVEALRRRDDVRAPDQEVRVGGVDLGASATRGAGGAVAGTVTGSATLHGGGGVRTDHTTGAKTYFLEGGADTVLDLSASLRGVRMAGSGQAAGTARLALTVDRDGRWVDLAVMATGEAAASARLPQSAGPLADALNTPTSGGRRWVAEAHLDLNDAGNLAAAEAVVDGLRAVPPAPLAVGAAARELARRIDERAVVDVRAYTLARASDGFSVQAGDTVGLGGSRETSTELTRLLVARTRGLDGQWRDRDDCLKEARA